MLSGLLPWIVGEVKILKIRKGIWVELVVTPADNDTPFSGKEYSFGQVTDIKKDEEFPVKIRLACSCMLHGIERCAPSGFQDIAECNYDECVPISRADASHRIRLHISNRGKVWQGGS